MISRGPGRHLDPPLSLSSLENHFRKVHCLGTKEAGGRLLTRIVQRQRRTFICSPAAAGHAPQEN
jgi:hypothetical protein